MLCECLLRRHALFLRRGRSYWRRDRRVDRDRLDRYRSRRSLGHTILLCGIMPRWRAVGRHITLLSGSAFRVVACHVQQRIASRTLHGRHNTGVLFRGSGVVSTSYDTRLLATHSTMRWSVKRGCRRENGAYRKANLHPRRSNHCPATRKLGTKFLRDAHCHVMSLIRSAIHKERGSKRWRWVRASS